jgi:hypothetical protein
VRNGETFRAHKISGKVWRDWVVVDWEDYGNIPNKIWGYIDLRALPENTGINYGGLDGLQPAVLLSSKVRLHYGRIGDVSSEMFVPIKEVLEWSMVW